MTYLPEHTGPSTLAFSPVCRPAEPPLDIIHSCDPRWPEVAAVLAGLRHGNRRCVRILECECGSGEFLLECVRLARQLGFTAVEARGIDCREDLLGCARSRAASLKDPAVGIVFDRCELDQALAEEVDLPADILIWPGCRCSDADLDAALRRAVASASHVSIAFTQENQGGPVQSA